jgi:hypothetical protein
VLVIATIGSKALYFLFLWLLSASAAAWMTERKGYGERVGLMFGLILTVVGFLLVCLLPGRPGSAWREQGPIPRRSGNAGANATPPRPADSAPPPSPDDG